MKCNKKIRINTDVDEHEYWFCVKEMMHTDHHYAEKGDGSEGVAVSLTDEEKAYLKGYYDGVRAGRGVQ